jgi:hypothetical protein
MGTRQFARALVHGEACFGRLMETISLLPMSDAVNLHRHRRSQRRSKRRGRRHDLVTLFTRLAWIAAVLVPLASFAVGFAWRKQALDRESHTAPLEATAETKAEALRLLDRAVEAKHSQLWSEATRLALHSRKVNPATPGVDVLVAELALDQGQFEVLGAAARAALRREPTSANAKLLLALEAWILRGQTSASEAGAAATQLLREAATDELSNGAVRFFAGDFLRETGHPSEAHTNLLGGLHRQHPWHSAAVIIAKLGWATESAGSTAKVGSALHAVRDAKYFNLSAAALLEAIVNRDDAAVAALYETFTPKQIYVLSSDPAMSAGATALADSVVGISLPFGQVTPPSREDDAEVAPAAPR